MFARFDYQNATGEIKSRNTILLSSPSDAKRGTFLTLDLDVLEREAPYIAQGLYLAMLTGTDCPRTSEQILPEAQFAFRRFRPERIVPDTFICGFGIE